MFTELYSDKVDKVTGKYLSTNDFTAVLKSKLDNIEPFAEVNVQSDWNQADDSQDNFIKNKPAIPVTNDFTLNGGYTGTAQDIVDLIGSGATVLPFTETDLVNETSGGVDYWYIALTLATLGTKRHYYIEVNNVQVQVYYDGSLGRLIGFDNVITSQTINVYTI